MRIKTLIVPDIHGSVAAFVGLLKRAGAIEMGDKGWVRRDGYRIIQLGDLANMSAPWRDFRGFRSQDAAILKLAVDGFVDDLLVGNHELHYTHNLPAGSWSGMADIHELDPKTMPRIRALVNQGQWNAAAEANGWLITHAGLHPKHTRDMPDNAKETADYLNILLLERALREKVYHPAIDGDDSIFWMRPFDVGRWRHPVTKTAMSYGQIVGHTPRKDHPRYVPVRKMWYLDTGGYANTYNPYVPGLIAEGKGDWKVI